MGVLSDGTPYLNARGLARLCGVHHSRIGEMSKDWKAVSLVITKSVKANLGTKGIIVEQPYLEIRQRSGLGGRKALYQNMRTGNAIFLLWTI
jgi:hypothetical protein